MDDLPDPNQTDGYLVLLKPERALAKWQVDTEGLARSTERQAYFTALRNTLPSANPLRYKGISRYPIKRYHESGFSPGAAPRSPDERAERRIHQLYGNDPNLHFELPFWFDADLLPSFEVAREILDLTDAPSDHEIIHVALDELVPSSKTLGFDIGYWGSDHFSIIADTMIMPRWHGCPEEELGALALWGSKLNDHMLFTTAADAVDYRNWYRTRPWAESEGRYSEFNIIRADIAP